MWTFCIYDNQNDDYRDEGDSVCRNDDHRYDVEEDQGYQVDDLVGQVDENDKNQNQDQVEDFHLLKGPTSSPRPPVLASLLFFNCQIVEEIKSGNDKDFQQVTIKSNASC